LFVDVASYKIVNVYKPPHSRLTPTTIPTFPHPSLYIGDFNCQLVNDFNCQLGLLGNLDVVQPKGSSQFPLSPLECRHQPTPGLREFWPGQPTARQTCPRKVPAVTTSALPHNATKIRGPYPQRSGEALELSQGRLEALLPSHRWIRWEIATSGHTRPFRGHTRIFARAYFLRLNNVSHVAVRRTTCHAGTKSVKSHIAPSSKPQWGLPLTEPYRPYSLDNNRRSDVRKLSTPSTSCTLATRSGVQSTNLLAGLGAPLTCAPSWQIQSLRNLWRTGHTRLAAASPPGSSTNICLTYGRFQHLRVTASPNPSGQKSLLLPSDAWSRESLRDLIPSSRSLYSTPSRLSNLGPATFSIPACTNSKFQRPGEKHK